MIQRLAVCFLLFTCGCATYNAATGRSEVIFVSTSTEVSMGAQAHRELSRKNKIIEGTDETIKRGGLLGRGDVTVVKVAKPNQDMRFDVPAVGLGTMEQLLGAKACALAFEAGKTLLMDLEPFIQKANQAGIVVMGISDEK